MKKLLCVFSLIIISTVAVNAQFYIGPFVGFKASGLKGAFKLARNGQTQVGNVADGGSTGFNAGLTVGYQVIPPEVAGGLYKLDIDLDASWSSFSYFENSFNSVNGSGKYSADGLSGGTTNVFSFDVMPINRFNFHNFILSPYAGLGVGVNLLLTSDVTLAPPSATGTLTGNSEVKIGLIVFYGTIFNVSSVIKPFIQFKHLIPFGSETQFTQNFQSAQGAGSQIYAFSTADVPGYFNLTAGVRFVF